MMIRWWGMMGQRKVSVVGIMVGEDYFAYIPINGVAA